MGVYSILMSLAFKARKRFIWRHIVGKSLQSAVSVRIFELIHHQSKRPGQDGAMCKRGAIKASDQTMFDEVDVEKGAK